MEIGDNVRKLLENTVVKNIKNAKIEEIKKMSVDELVAILIIEILNRKSIITTGSSGMTINM